MRDKYHMLSKTTLGLVFRVLEGVNSANVSVICYLNKYYENLGLSRMFSFCARIVLLCMSS